MYLSELQTGERAVITKVLGHGGFRKRIIEMGFVAGKTVEVLLNAPLLDPVKYRLMGYEVSLRHDEARLIEVVSEEEAKRAKELMEKSGEAESLEAIIPTDDDCFADDNIDEIVKKVARKRHHRINVALVGNPNCGKTSLFNFASGAHARVGNYSGVTVDATDARAHFEDYEFILTDLPGTYSLSCYSPEELFVRQHLFEQRPDIVINVIDSSNLERNLYLTTQLIDMNLRVVCALNMYDEFERRGDKLNIDTLATLFGVPMVPTSFKSGMNVDKLFHAIIELYEGKDKTYRHIHINHGKYIEKAIETVQVPLKERNTIRDVISTRYLAIKLLEGDKNAYRRVGKEPDKDKILKVRDDAAKQIDKEMHKDAETAIMDAKYGFIHGALSEAEYEEGKSVDTYRVTHIVDAVLSNKYLGIPVFLFILYVMFQTTFSLGQYPMDWIEAGVAWLGEWIGGAMNDGPLSSMIVDGIIGGVGSVIVFLPQILILYCFISFMEDSGYMARAAFIMDKLMHKMGLHGKSFIPLIMGFGCNVPAVMATRTIESRRSRLITMLILPFMSCSARLPIYIMIAGTFFAVQYRSMVMISLYVIGVLMAVIVSKIFSSLVIKGEDTPFVMELPPYRWPTPKAIWRHTWEKGKEYLKKMGGIILAASIVVWALGYFPHDDKLDFQQQQEQSYIGRMGKAIEPVFAPQGFNWKLDVSLIAGVGAKEIVASTVGVLYSGDDSFADDDSFSDDSEKYTVLNKQMTAEGITPLIAYCYLLFILLYFPCLATIVAIKNETGKWRWAVFAAVYTTVIAWCVSAAVYQIGILIS
ncbi:MAG: ferrous iron transport protein B [Prevotella sp.]|nr:ferrous iron transport protein B [Prevotella sp.]